MKSKGVAYILWFLWLFGLCVVFVPLGLWKLVEICIWIYNHDFFFTVVETVV